MMCRWVWLALCVAVVPGCVSVNGGSRPMGSIGQADLPQPGEWVRATYPKVRSGLAISQRQVVGKVDTVDENGIHLTEVEGRFMSSAVMGLHKAPMIGRLFKNTGVGRESQAVVHPAELESLELVTEAERQQRYPSTIAQQLTAAVPGPQRLARRL